MSRRRPRSPAVGAAEDPAPARRGTGSPVRPRPTARQAALSRRRFMSLLAAGSASALLASSRALAAAAPTAKPKATASPTPRMRAEIDKQKKSTADMLQVIRDYELPAGSPMAFEFRPLRRRHGK